MISREYIVAMQPAKAIQINNCDQQTSVVEKETSVKLASYDTIPSYLLTPVETHHSRKHFR